MSRSGVTYFKNICVLYAEGERSTGEVKLVVHSQLLDIVVQAPILGQFHILLANMGR